VERLQIVQEIKNCLLTEAQTFIGNFMFFSIRTINEIMHD